MGYLLLQIYVKKISINKKLLCQYHTIGFVLADVFDCSY